MLAMGIAAFVILHLIYGAIVGTMYGPAVHGPIEIYPETISIGIDES